MPGKSKSQYVCQACGAVATRWSGKCDTCGAWNTLSEETVVKKQRSTARTVTATPVRIRDIEGAEVRRLSTGFREFDRVLGGGFIPGSVTLLGGDPGIGKSTLMMQLGRDGGPEKILYISGEESLRQLKLRAERLGATRDGFLVLAETDLEEVSAAISRVVPDLVVIDSIQTVYRAELDSAPGTVTQVRECTAALLRQAKETHVPIVIVGHVTKDGLIAGPRLLEHMVDTVLQFEGDHHHVYRIVRGVKNRFGSTNEIGIFEMRESGLAEITNPSEVLLSERSRGISGSCIAPSLEGTRALLVEVQALVTPTNYGVPQRTVTGFDARRVSLLLAVIEKRFGLRTGQFDVFVNVAGGIRVDEPAIDLAVAAAIVSSARDQAIDASTAVIGELGLGGEVRSVRQIEKRLSETAKLGLQRVIIPRGNVSHGKRTDMKIIEVDDLRDAMSKILDG